MLLIHKKFLAFRFITSIHPAAWNLPFNSYEDTAWPPQCHNFDSTAGAGGFTAGAAAPAVNMLEEALGRWATEHDTTAKWVGSRSRRYLDRQQRRSSRPWSSVEILVQRYPIGGV